MGNGALPAIIGRDHYFNFLSHWFVLANGQSSCVGSHAPHGSDRRFLRDESQSSHGVWGKPGPPSLLPTLSWCGGWEGVGSLSTGSPSGGGSGTCTSA